jgi:hypothetical protein
MQEAGDHSRYAKADCHRKYPSTGSAKMGRISSLTNTDTHRYCAINCRAMDGFHRIRHYGLLASGGRKTRLAKIRSLLCVQPTEQAAARATEPEVAPLTLREPCPCCGGPMRIIEIFRRGQKPMSRAPPREQAA